MVIRCVVFERRKNWFDCVKMILVWIFPDPSSSWLEIWKNWRTKNMATKILIITDPSQDPWKKSKSPKVIQRQLLDIKVWLLTFLIRICRFETERFGRGRDSRSRRLWSGGVDYSWQIRIEENLRFEMFEEAAYRGNPATRTCLQREENHDELQSSIHCKVRNS